MSSLFPSPLPLDTDPWEPHFWECDGGQILLRRSVPTDFLMWLPGRNLSCYCLHNCYLNNKTPQNFKGIIGRRFSRNYLLKYLEMQPSRFSWAEWKCSNRLWWLLSLFSFTFLVFISCFLPLPLNTVQHLLANTALSRKQQSGFRQPNTWTIAILKMFGQKMKSCWYSSLETYFFKWQCSII